MLMFFAIPKVDAATLVCTKSYYSKMKARAYQTTVNYELHTPKDEEAYFTISFSNLQKGVYISFQGNTIKYDETKERLFAFVGLNGNDHIDKKKYFNPSISIKNTNLFSRHPGYNNDIRYIEEHLEKYIYNF